MRINNIQNTPNFNGLKYDKNLPKTIIDTIENSNTLKRFGKKYDAEVDYVIMQGKNNKKHPAFLISNINPKGIQKIIDKIKGVNSQDQFIYVTTRGVEAKDLQKKFMNVADNYMINLYQKTFSDKNKA